MFTIENLLNSKTLRTLAVETSTLFPQTFRPFGACGVFYRLLQAGASQKVLKEALSSYPSYVEEWIRLLNADESVDSMAKEMIGWHTDQRPSWGGLKAFENGQHCPFLYDKSYNEHEDEADTSAYWQRQWELRFTFDGHWYDSDNCMVIPDLGSMVKTNDFEQHSRDMAEKYKGCPVVLFSRSYEYEGCWSSWSCGTKVDSTTHHYHMAVPFVNGKLVYEAWSFAPMWEGAKTIGLGFFDQEQEEEEAEVVLPPRFRAKVLKASKQALRKGKKIKLAA